MTISVKAMPSNRLIVFYALVSTAAILYLPYFFPLRPTASGSYYFGYNNRVGIILLIVFSIGGALWTRGLNLDLRPAGPAKDVSLKTLWICVSTTLASCVAMNLVAGRFGGFRESSYEIDRAWLLSQGKIPYVDFEWPFGILLLDGPLWLSHLVHLGIAQSYYLFWTAASVVGVVLLFVTVNLVSYPSLHKNTIFLLLYICSLTSTLSMGTHYTLLRYLCPLCFILLVHKAGIRAAQPAAQLLPVLLALSFTACLLLISPETAIAHAFACLILLFPRRSTISPAPLGIPSYLAMMAGHIVLFALSFKLHLLDTMIASGGGADGFPIPLALPVLFFFFVVFLCACAIVRRWSRPDFQDNSVALIVISIPMLAAALGRCDPGHIFLNGIGFILAAAIYCSSSPHTWRLYRNSFIFAMLAIFVLDTLFLLPSLGKLQKIQLSVASPKIDIFALYPELDRSRLDGLIEAPFGYKPNSIGSYLSSQIDYGFYEGVENANTPAAVNRKIDELARHPKRAILIRENTSHDVCTVDASKERLLISSLFLFPYMARISHPQNVRKPICDYIAANYQLAYPATLENYRYELWMPKTQTP
jgi:hypothetical protein